MQRKIITSLQLGGHVFKSLLYISIVALIFFDICKYLLIMKSENRATNKSLCYIFKMDADKSTLKTNFNTHFLSTYA